MISAYMKYEAQQLRREFLRNRKIRRQYLKRNREILERLREIKELKND